MRQLIAIEFHYSFPFLQSFLLNCHSCEEQEPYHIFKKLKSYYIQSFLPFVLAQDKLRQESHTNNLKTKKILYL